MKLISKAGPLFFSIALASLMIGTLARAQDRGRGANPQEPPTAKGKVAAYEADASITLETKVRGGQVIKTEFCIVKDKTRIELGDGVKAIEVGRVVSVWADKENPKNALRIVAEADAPSARGKVTAYEADKSIAIETTARGGVVRKNEFSIVKVKTRIELGDGVKAIEAGMVVSVWADKDDPNTAVRIAVQGTAPAGRNRGGAPADKAEPSKPSAPATAPKAEGPVDVNKVLEAYKSNLPTDKNLEWYTLDWVNTLGEAKARAARENRPILFIQTNKEGDLFCSLC